MKMLIKESKRDVLAKQMLNKKFPDLNVNEDDYEDSNGVHRRLLFDNNDGVIMVWSDSNNILYVCWDVVDDLKILSYTNYKLNNVVEQWFSETFNLSVNRVRVVPKFSLN
jgi:hypothetical protein